GVATDPRLLVAAECGVGRIGMIAVGPDPARLDRPAEAVTAIGVTAPDTGAEAVKRVVGDRQRLVIVLEGRDRYDWPENFLLKDAHLVVAVENRRLDIISAGKIARQPVPLTAGQHLRAFLAADVERAQDLLKLFAGGLRAMDGRRVERIALNNGFDALQRPLHEPVIDRFVDQRAAW